MKTVKNLIAWIPSVIMLLSACADEEMALNSAPVILEQQFSVIENAAIGTSVGTVLAHDPDQDEISYSISSSTVANAFEINPTTGELKVISTELLDFESTPSFSLMIIVDDGENASEATIIIELIDVNDFSFDDNTYELINGHIIERQYNTGHSGRYYIMVNDSIITNLQEKIYIAARLQCFNRAEFIPGVFEFENPNDTEPNENGLFIRLFSLGVAGKGLYEGISGTITVIRQGDLHYTIEGTVLVEQLQDSEGNYTGGQDILEELTFSYTGSFTYSNR